MSLTTHPPLTHHSPTPPQVEQYLPALRTSTAEKAISLNQFEKMSLGLKFGGTLVKMFYAFLWQEVSARSKAAGHTVPTKGKLRPCFCAAACLSHVLFAYLPSGCSHSARTTS